MHKMLKRLYSSDQNVIQSEFQVPPYRCEVSPLSSVITLLPSLFLHGTLMQHLRNIHNDAEINKYITSAAFCGGGHGRAVRAVRGYEELSGAQGDS